MSEHHHHSREHNHHHQGGYSRSRPHHGEQGYHHHSSSRGPVYGNGGSSSNYGGGSSRYSQSARQDYSAGGGSRIAPDQGRLSRDHHRGSDYSAAASASGQEYSQNGYDRSKRSSYHQGYGQSAQYGGESQSSRPHQDAHHSSNFMEPRSVNNHLSGSSNWHSSRDPRMQSRDRGDERPGGSGSHQGIGGRGPYESNYYSSQRPPSSRNAPRDYDIRHSQRQQHMGSQSGRSPIQDSYRDRRGGPPPSRSGQHGESSRYGYNGNAGQSSSSYRRSRSRSRSRSPGQGTTPSHRGDYRGSAGGYSKPPSTHHYRDNYRQGSSYARHRISPAAASPSGVDLRQKESLQPTRSHQHEDHNLAVIRQVAPPQRSEAADQYPSSNMAQNDKHMSSFDVPMQAPAPVVTQKHPAEIAKALVDKYGTLFYSLARGKEEAWRDKMLRVAYVGEPKASHFTSAHFEQIQQQVKSSLKQDNHTFQKRIQDYCKKALSEAQKPQKTAAADQQQEKAADAGDGAAADSLPITFQRYVTIKTPAGGELPKSEQLLQQLKEHQSHLVALQLKEESQKSRKQILAAQILSKGYQLKLNTPKAVASLVQDSEQGAAAQTAETADVFMAVESHE